jgi:hypothetical protein
MNEEFVCLRSTPRSTCLAKLKSCMCRIAMARQTCIVVVLITKIQSLILSFDDQSYITKDYTKNSI